MAHILDSVSGSAWRGDMLPDVTDVTIEDVLREWLPEYAGMSACDVVADIRRRRSGSAPCQPPAEGGLCGCDEADDGPGDCLQARCDC